MTAGEAIKRLNNQIEASLSEYLRNMKANSAEWSDGFNDAWTIVNDLFCRVLSLAPEETVPTHDFYGWRYDDCCAITMRRRA